jgi:hypothetical protein
MHGWCGELDMGADDCAVAGVIAVAGAVVSAVPEGVLAALAVWWRTLSGADPSHPAGIVEVAEQDAAGLPGRWEQARGRQRLCAHVHHFLRTDTDLMAAPLIFGGDVVWPFEVDVSRPMLVARQAREEQRLRPSARMYARRRP